MKLKIAYVSDAAERAFQKLPRDVQEDFVKALDDLQKERTPSMPFKYLKAVGKGAIELIINGSPAYRTIYVAKYNDTIYILHAFTKTTNGTDQPAINVAKERYKKIPQ
jgi:phage-related protein